jgi:hypothetical protein
MAAGAQVEPLNETVAPRPNLSQNQQPKKRGGAPTQDFAHGNNVIWIE